MHSECGIPIRLLKQPKEVACDTSCIDVDKYSMFMRVACCISCPDCPATPRRSSNISTPVRRKKHHNGSGAARGSILAYSSDSAAAQARSTSAAGTGAFANQVLGKQKLALKQPLVSSGSFTH
jgi:hypothetical protein